jgi:hypothetical protein
MSEPKVYARRLNSAQRRMLNEYIALTGFEPLGQEDLDAGEITFKELWDKNVEWLRDLATDVQNIDCEGGSPPRLAPAAFEAFKAAGQ